MAGAAAFALLPAAALDNAVFPRGGGVVHLAVAPLAPGASLPPLVLEARGQVVRLATYAFTAGKVPVSVAQRMVAAADKGAPRCCCGRGLAL